MPTQQPNQSRALQSPPDQFFPQTNDYAVSNMQTQAPYSTSLSAQDWTQPSYGYTGGTEQYNYQIDEPTVYGDDASLHLKIQSITTLDNLSSQIIINIAKPSLPDILLLTAGRNYDESQAYFTRRALFDQTRKVFTRSSVFIDCNTMPNVFTASQLEVLRKANRATFISSILEGHDISFYDLDARFLDTFVSTGQRLLKWQGSIFLELKTQAYIAGLMNNDALPEVLLHELFPLDLEQKIIARHPDSANISPAEQDFLDRARARKQYLADEPPYEALGTLRQKYGWQEFLREFALCINKNIESITSNPVSIIIFVTYNTCVLSSDCSRHALPRLHHFPPESGVFRSRQRIDIPTTGIKWHNSACRCWPNKVSACPRHHSPHRLRPILKFRFSSNKMLVHRPRQNVPVQTPLRFPNPPSPPRVQSPLAAQALLANPGSKKRRMPCSPVFPRSRDRIGHRSSDCMAEVVV